MEILDRVYLITLGGSREPGAGPQVNTYYVAGDQGMLTDMLEPIR